MIKIYKCYKNYIFMEKIIKQILKKSLKKSSTLGSYQFYILIALVFLSLGFVKEFIFLIIGIILLYSFAIPIRLIFFRERPIKRIYTNLIEKIDASSMPSQHSSRTTILYLVLTNFFKFEIGFTILITLISISIMYARIYKKQHHPTDIFVGIILGIFIYFLTNLIL